jgi:hypothetical protein
MITYDWEITGLYKKNINNFNDVITNIQFSLIATNESNQLASYKGAISLDLTNLNEQSFLSLNELNNDILLEWLETSVKSDERYWLHIEEVIYNQFIIKSNSNDLGTKISGSL